MNAVAIAPGSFTFVASIAILVVGFGLRKCDSRVSAGARTA
jgi:hypothetical protein